jgi:hypothetical protein
MQNIKLKYKYILIKGLEGISVVEYFMNMCEALGLTTSTAKKEYILDRQIDC